MAGASTEKKGGKKIGRGLRSPTHTRYTNSGRRKYNKIRKLKKHLKKMDKHPFSRPFKLDKVAIAALKRLQ